MERGVESGNGIATAKGSRAIRISKRVSSQSNSRLGVAALCLLSILCVASTTALAAVHKHHHHKTTSGPVTRHFNFDISLVNVTRNCVNKALVAVNGQYPGPTVDVTEGDRVIVKVTNHANTNVTIHWHGIRQILSSWQDGVGYITQCSIQSGDYFIYDFIVTNQRGTTFWHAHVSWVRATVHGAFVTRPRLSYPFPKPFGEFPIVLGEWWNGDVEQIELAGVEGGASFQLADALTMNGWPGPQYNCSSPFDGIANFEVEQGKTYLLRLVNAALNSALYFGIANHTLTVVEADSEYVKPLSVEQGVYVGAGQTLSVLVTADQHPGTYYAGAIAVHSLLVTDVAEIPAPELAFVMNDVPRVPTTGFFKYIGSPAVHTKSILLPELPAYNDTDYRDSFENKLKTLRPELVPCGPSIRHLFYAVGTATQPCSAADPCPASGPYRAVAAINNVTFQLPTISILQAHFFNISGIYRADFPDTPDIPYDYTNPDSPPPVQQVSQIATRVTSVRYGTTIQLILQDDNYFAFEAHPFHLHGFFFYVLGRGYGNYDPNTDPAKFNTVDPPARFTVDVPQRGWVAIRFKADNPGAWLLHCHLDKHTTWGMQTAFIVENGVGPNETLPPPPRLTPC